jgi:adenylosuccinate lyase
MGNLSLPGNPRYQPKDLQSVFGYDNLFRTVAEVEIATLKTLADIGIIPKANIASLTPVVERELLAISTSEVDDVESKVTKHDIRAWVRIAQSKVDPGLSTTLAECVFATVFQGFAFGNMGTAEAAAEG